MIAAATHAASWRTQTTDSGSEEWGTPAAIYLPLDQEFDFTIDVAADPGNAKHVRYFPRDVDALMQSWAGERVFCNPPYGREIVRWVRKGYLEASEHGALVVFLVPARTGNLWFHQYVLGRAEVRFIQGRLSYTLGGASRKKRAPFDSMVVIYRPWQKESEHSRAQLLFPFASRVR